MPRLTEAMCNLRTAKYANKNLRDKPMLRPRLPQVLKDSVRGENESTNDGCIKELQAVLSCFSKHEYKSKPCLQVIQGYQDCFAEMERKEKERKRMEAEGLIAEETNQLTRKQVNTLLRRQPQLRPHDPFKMHDTFKKQHY